MQSQEQPDASVLVVGAGPTGLTLATVLARYGVPVRIIEKKPGLSRHTKATNLMQRNQELMSALGLLDPLNEIGGQMRRMMVHAYGACLGPRTMRLKESPFTDVILCGQHNFEAVVERGLRNAGVTVEFGTELTALAQDGTGVTATMLSGGISEAARFSFVVGCDGYAGVSKRFTELNFEPKRTGVAIRQVDCRLRWRRLSSMEQMWLFYFDQGFAVVVPLPGGVHRVLTIEPKAAFPEREPTLEEMQAKLRTVADDGSIVLSEPEWFSYTDLSMGMAKALRDRRILLAGDVGNPVLPNGGQGMNTGIADAFNLGWKLAGVLRHGAPDALLDTYGTERHSLRAKLQRFQFNSLKYTTLVTPRLMRAAFRRFADPLLDRGGEYRMALTFSELAINTRRSPLSEDSLGKQGLRAGDRALDAQVVVAGRDTRLYDLIYRGGWTLLGFGGTAQRDGATMVAEAIRALGRPDLQGYVVSTAGAELPSTEVLHDLDEEAHRTYGIKEPQLLLVRPDGHVGLRIRPNQAARLNRYLATWLPDASQRFLGDVAAPSVAGWPLAPAAHAAQVAGFS